MLVGALIAAMGAGAARSAPRIPTDVPAEPATAIEQDPLTKEILRASTTRADGGLVAAIRLSPELTGVDHEQILTLGAHAR